MEESGELMDYENHIIIMPEEVIMDVREAENIGKKLYQKFLDNRVHSEQEPFTASLSRTKLKLLNHDNKLASQKRAKSMAKTSQQIGTQLLLA